MTELPIRPDIKRTIDDYVSDGMLPGGFVRACLENDLALALGRADDYNRKAIYSIVKYMWNDIPSNVWGDPETVERHLRECAERRAAGAE